MYFRTIAEDHAQQRDNDKVLKALLGKDYNSKYQYMLRYLSPEQFINFDSKPMNGGTSGLVHGAVWKQPTAFLHSMRPANASRPVVVKQIHPKISKTDSVGKILHEVCFSID
jgi:hypothetical protein